MNRGAVRKQHSTSFEYWMTCLPEEKKQIPIIDLAIPGSHNSFSYTITPKSDVSPDSPFIVQRLSHLCKPLVNPIIYKWSLTQNQDISSQLEAGIRYLDIRTVSRNNTLYVAHGLYGDPIIPLLQQVSEFLSSHLEEIVILDFQHFYNFSEQDHKKLLECLYDIFGKKLSASDRSIECVTLKSMIRQGEQVLAVYRHTPPIHAHFIIPSCYWPTPWPNKINTKDLIRFLDKEISTRNHHLGFVTQFLLTVDVSYVLKHPFSNLLGLTHFTRRKLFPWVTKKEPNDVNVVIVDFVDQPFVSVITCLNRPR